MRELEAGKNYVTIGGEETGPMKSLGEGLFMSAILKARDFSGELCGPQVWHADGSVFQEAPTERKHRIDLSEPKEEQFKRWEVSIVYRLGNGFVDTVETTFDEFHELGDIIERGRDFHTIEDIVVRLNPEHLAQMYKRG